MITTNDRVKIVKGCSARGIDKGVTCKVIAIVELGADYSHSVKVSLMPLNGFKGGQRFAFYAQHVNRLSDEVINLNDGNPTHKIQIVKI